MNFTLLKGNCPICGGSRNGKQKWDCKQSGELIHCFSHNDPPPGFRFVGQSAIGQSMYAPVRDQRFDQDAHRATLKRLRAAHQAEQAKRRAQLPSIQERHQKILGFEAQLTVAQNADLLRRGLTQAEIDLALGHHWLFACRDGYGISAVDSLSGMFCGAQRALNDHRERKYDWALFAGRNHLRETDENPLFVWQHPVFDPMLSFEVKFCEGALKSLIRAFMEWRRNPQVILVGAAGGHFGEQSLQRLLSLYGGAAKFTLLPDADSQNLRKKNLYAGYGALAQAIPALKFADWGQWRHAHPGDCDETFGTKYFQCYRRRNPQDWLRLFSFETQRQWARQRLQGQALLRPDLVLSRTEFQALTAPQLRQLTGQARDVFIQGGRGIGKTEKAKLITADWERAIAPYHRQSLARNGADRLGFTYRTDCDVLEGQFIASSGLVERIAYCNESYLPLQRPLHLLLKQGAGVFVDELDQQIKNLLMSGTHSQRGRRHRHWQGFWQTLLRAQQTLSVSADLSQAEVDLFKQMTGRSPFVIVVLDDPKPTHHTVFEEQAQFWQRFHQLRQGGQRILVTCSRKSDVKFLQHAFGAVAIHGDNAADYHDFFAHPDLWLTYHQPQLMAVSPILGTGFSIEGDHFDAVLGFFWADSLTAPDLLQFLDRYRPTVPRYVWCAEGSPHPGPLTPEACYQARLAKARLSTLRQETALIQPDDPFFFYQAERHWSLAHLRADLLARLERDFLGLDYQLSDLPEAVLKATMKEISALRQDYRQSEYLQCLAADNLDAAAATRLREHPHQLTENDHRALRKYDLADWKCLDPAALSLDDLLRDRNGQRRLALERLEQQAFPCLAHGLDQAALEVQRAHGICHQDLRHHGLRVQALQALGIDQVLDFVLSGQEWHGDHFLVRRTAQKLRLQRDELKAMGITLSCGRDASDNAYFGALLRFFDLRTVRRQQRRGNVVTSFYHLCPEDLVLTQMDLLARLPRHQALYGEQLMSNGAAWVERLYRGHSHLPSFNQGIQGSVTDVPFPPEKTVQGQKQWLGVTHIRANPPPF